MGTPYLDIPDQPANYSEQTFIRWLRQKVQSESPHLQMGIGDDAAILSVLPDEELVVATDMLLEGSCFRIHEAGPRRVGRKALAVNLSDLAAMGARPLGCLVSLALPRDHGGPLACEIMEGILEHAHFFSCPVIGGDTNSWRGPLAISITVLGAVQSGEAIRREGARPGDWLMVTGPLGGSILGHHLDFLPRVREALQLVQHVEIHAMIDISDGLARDTHTLCEASACGAVLQASAIPLRPEAFRLNDLASYAVPGLTALDHALGDGEDYELLFAVTPEDGRKLLSRQVIPAPQFFKVGECVEKGIWIDCWGKISALPPHGWQHQLEA